MLAAAFLIPSAAAESLNGATAFFSYATATIEGSPAISTGSLTGVWLPEGDGEFSWKLTADRIVVNWTKDTYIEIGQPPDFSDGEATYWIGNSSGENAFAAATVSSQSHRSESAVAVLNRTPGLAFAAAMGFTVLQPANGSSWRLQNQGSPPVRIAIPSGRTEAVAAGQAIVHGTFSIFIVEAQVQVDQGNTAHSFASGNWTEPIAPLPGGQPSPARYRYFQTLRVDAVNGFLTIESQERPAHAFAKEFLVDGNLSGDFEDAKGDVRRLGTNEAFRDSTFAVSGELSIRTWNETASPGRLRAEVRPTSLPTAAPRGLGRAAVPVKQPSLAVPDREPHRLGVMAVLVALGGLVFVGFLINARWQGLRPEDAELALLMERPGRARRISRRILNRHPSNGEALFLFATSFLVQRRHRELLEQVEPRAVRLDEDGRLTVAFVLAVAAGEVGDSVREARWAGEAARDPALRRQLLAQGIWKSGPEPVGARSVVALPGYG